MNYLILRIEYGSVSSLECTVSGKNCHPGGIRTVYRVDYSTISEAVAAVTEGYTGTARVVVCLPPVLFAQRMVELPLTDIRKVREILPAHLQGDIALPADEAVFEALPVQQGKYLALWAKQSELSQAIEECREAGCEPQIITSELFGWPYLPGVPADCIVCDGHAVAVIADKRLVYLRGLEGADAAGQLTLTLTALELTETGLPRQMLLLGDGVELQGALEWYPGTIQLAEEGNGEHPPVAEAEQGMAALCAVALACQAGDLPDFRRGGLRWTAGSAKARKRLMVTAGLFITAIVLLFVYQGIQYRTACNDIESLNRSIAAQYREIFPNRPKAVDELAEIRGELKKLAGSRSESSILDVLKKLAEARGTAIQGLYEAEIEGNAVRVKGEARTAQDVQAYRSALAGVLAGVEPGEIKSRPDGTVTFSLTGSVRESAK